MSEFSVMEASVSAALAALTDGGKPLFAAVQSEARADRAARLAALARTRAPAALVTVEGRKRGSDLALSGLTIVVTIAVRSLRSTDAARVGDVDTVGAFTVAERARIALNGLLVGARRLAASEERIVAADTRQVVIEQVWTAESAF